MYAWNDETFGPAGTLGRADTREVVLTRDLHAAITQLNPGLPTSAVGEAVATLTLTDFSRSMLQHNQECYKFIRDGVPVKYRDTNGQGKARSLRPAQRDVARDAARVLPLDAAEDVAVSRDRRRLAR